MHEQPPASSKLTTFLLDEQTALSVHFVEAMQVREGVSCDVYRFEGDDTRDLAIITVQKGFKTPLQRVLQGDETLEGFVRGEGTLTVWSEDDRAVVHQFGPGAEAAVAVSVGVGQRMQWQATAETDLIFYEICTPPYQKGRFEDLSD